jgi:hypothetical protein
MPWGRYCTLIVLVFNFVPVIAGEVPGLPPQNPPFIAPDLEVVFSNDFLGRGGSIDDFRTQQIVIAAKFSDKWIAILDHSILTLGSSLTPARVDQLSASLGYQIINEVNDHSASKVTAGIGVRSAGDFAGERMQIGVASCPSLDVWLGLRRDWREGYDRAIFRETAEAEDGRRCCKLRRTAVRR